MAEQYDFSQFRKDSAAFQQQVLALSKLHGNAAVKNISPSQAAAGKIDPLMQKRLEENKIKEQETEIVTVVAEGLFA